MEERAGEGHHEGDQGFQGEGSIFDDDRIDLLPTWQVSSINPMSPKEAREKGYEAHLVAVPTGHVDRNTTSDTLPVDDNLGLAQQGMLSNIIQSRLSIDAESLFRWCSFRLAVSTVS